MPETARKVTILFFIFTSLFSFWVLGTTNAAIVASAISNLKSSYFSPTPQGFYREDATLGYFHGAEYKVPPMDVSTKELASVLGVSNEPKRIEVDLTNQRLYAYEGDRRVFDFLVSTGKWGRTPPGNYTIWVKLRYTLMQGGSTALNTYYYLPNVPYVMFFEGSTDDGEYLTRNRGYSLHGTYWHNNFGHPMSHGCVNMRTEEVAQLFYWADPSGSSNVWSIYSAKDNPGTPVRIYGTPPET